MANRLASNSARTGKDAEHREPLLGLDRKRDNALGKKIEVVVAATASGAKQVRRGLGFAAFSVRQHRNLFAKCIKTLSLDRTMFYWLAPIRCEKQLVSFMPMIGQAGVAIDEDRFSRSNNETVFR